MAVPLKCASQGNADREGVFPKELYDTFALHSSHLFSDLINEQDARVVKSRKESDFVLIFQALLEKQK